MTLRKRDRDALAHLLDKYGHDAVVSELKSVEMTESSELTIVSNAGLHPIPHDFVFGHLYIASEGNLDFSSVESVNSEIDKILTKLRETLKMKRWRKVYLIPFGHSVLSMNIKMAVYRTLRIETIDVFFFGEGRYGVLERETRAVMLQD